MTPLLVGVDVGGTATRAAVADNRSGIVLGVGQESGGNPNVVGADAATNRIRAAVDAALRQAGDTAATRADVRGMVLGMSGYGTARSTPEFARSCCPDGVDVMPRIVSDVAVAYSSATAEPHGYVVVAGTGAVAAEIDQAEIVRRRDGWGWLLGDQGSGFWLGREAVRATLAELERASVRPLAGTRPERSPLAATVLDWFSVDDLDDLLAAAYGTEPRSLADLAPLVTALSCRDTAAAGLCQRAGELLADLIDSLDPAMDRPVVTGGSVLQHADGVRSALIDRLGRGPRPVPGTGEATSGTGRAILTASSGLVGAMWVATATDPSGAPLPDGGAAPDLHQALTRSITRLAPT